MPESLTMADILNWLDRLEARASKERIEQTERSSVERAEQTVAFSAALKDVSASNERGFNRLSRGMGGIAILLILGVLALAGVQVTISHEAPEPLTLSAPTMSALTTAHASEPPPAPDGSRVEP